MAKPASINAKLSGSGTAGIAASENAGTPGPAQGSGRETGRIHVWVRSVIIGRIRSDERIHDIADAGGRAE